METGEKQIVSPSLERKGYLVVFMNDELVFRFVTNRFHLSAEKTESLVELAREFSLRVK